MKRRRTLTYAANYPYFITTPIAHFIPLFRKPELRHLLIENLDFYRSKYVCQIHAYVIMPDHIHLIVNMQNCVGTISDFMRDFKRSTAKQIWRHLAKKEDQCLMGLFQNMAGYYHPHENRQTQIWRDRFDDVMIRNKAMFDQKINYIHLNPVKANLVKDPADYPYSSARNYIRGDHSIFRIDYPSYI